MAFCVLLWGKFNILFLIPAVWPLMPMLAFIIIISFIMTLIILLKLFFSCTVISPSCLENQITYS